MTESAVLLTSISIKDASTWQANVWFLRNALKTSSTLVVIVVLVPMDKLRESLWKMTARLK